MRITIERLRAGVLTGAGLLLLLLAVLLGVAHRRAHRLLHDLPGRLGADVQKETNGFTYSQTVKGKTIFTLHAAKATQRKDGVAALHDVGIVMYGPKGERADRIYGKDFDYDQSKGEVRAMGEVQLDLAAAAPATMEGRAAYARGAKAGSGPGRALGDETQPVHVTTSGLVYLQKLGVASTTRPIHFEYRGFTGDAKGAAFNSDTGVTTLESDVHISGLRDGRPAVLTATHAEMDRTKQTLSLRSAHYVSVGTREHGGSALRQEISAVEMLVHFGPESEVRSLEGRGGVAVADDTGTMRGKSGTVAMNAGGKPETAHLMGGVSFATASGAPEAGGREGVASTKTTNGVAREGAARFDAQGRVERVQLTGDAAMTSEGDASERKMHGQEVVLTFAAAGAGRPLLQEAIVTGDARVETSAPGKAEENGGIREELRGDSLVAKMRDRNGVAELSTVVGSGHTFLRRVADGVTETSQGAALEASFEPVAAGGGGKQGRGALQVVSAVQRGGVQFARIAVATRGRAAQTMRGTALEARFDGATQRLTLAGRVEIVEPGSALGSERLVIARESGDAEATGAVQATYRQQSASGAEVSVTKGSSEPIHVVGARALLRRSVGVATFFGSAEAKARLWQGDSQVEAPMLVFSQSEGVLEASAAPGESALRPVETVLADRSGAAGSGSAGKGRPGVTRIQSGRLHYSSAMRQAEFREGVLLEDANGSLSCARAVATLRPQQGGANDGSKQSGRSAAPSFGGGVERVVASGDVEVRQPGRKATGEQAVYTAADGLVVLTGAAGAPPRVVDEATGTLMGGSLRFHAGDNSVVVDGRSEDGKNASADGRVHTRTRVKQGR